MLRTRERAAHEPPSIINRWRNWFTAPPFVTIDSDESPPSLPPQLHRPRRNRSPTPIAVVYPPHEPPVSADLLSNSPVEPPNSSDSQDRTSPRPNVYAHQTTQPGPSRRTPRSPNDLASSSTPTADDAENYEDETNHHDTDFCLWERGQFWQERGFMPRRIDPTGI